jgi:2-amino-4-hydroxy-6-hydroxymethyldihydropteridine diphosphokinase
MLLLFVFDCIGNQVAVARRPDAHFSRIHDAIYGKPEPITRPIIAQALRTGCALLRQADSCVYDRRMILIGLGGNMDWDGHQPPETFLSALTHLSRSGVRTALRSSVYVSAPWPRGEGPQFYNQVVCVDTKLSPGALLHLLLKVEAAHGRLRREAWGPRTLDLDILDYWGLVTDTDHLALPHPWVESRAFVLKPVVEIAPLWRHPMSGLRAEDALTALDPAEVEDCRLLIQSN